MEAVAKIGPSGKLPIAGGKFQFHNLKNGPSLGGRQLGSFQEFETGGLHCINNGKAAERADSEGKELGSFFMEVTGVCQLRRRPGTSRAHSLAAAATLARAARAGQPWQSRSASGFIAPGFGIALPWQKGSVCVRPLLDGTPRPMIFWNSIYELRIHQTG
jgi:hypothetical protein